MSNSPYGPAPQQTFRSPPSMVPAPIVAPGGTSTPSPRVLELPWPLVRQQVPTLAPIFARRDQITSTIALWASQDGESYQQQTLGAARFAAPGTLAADYPDSTPLIDETVGMLVNWAGDDRVESVSDADAGAHTLLAFVDNEILSIRDITILSATQVQLTGHRRGIYCTPIETHAAGANILFLRRDQLRPFSDPFRYRYGTTWWWKMQSVWFNRYLPLDQCDPLPGPATIQAATCQPAPHVNLSVNGAMQNAVCAWGSDVNVAWDLTDWRAEAFWSLFSAPFVPREIGSLIEVLDATATLVRRAVLGVGVSSWTYTSADQSADAAQYLPWATPPASFKIRLYSLWDGYASSAYQEILVWT
jgi:hypothetical protein